MKARSFSSHGNKTKYLFWLLQTSVRRIVYGVCTAGSGEEKAEKKKIALRAESKGEGSEVTVRSLTLSSGHCSDNFTSYSFLSLQLPFI